VQTCRGIKAWVFLKAPWEDIHIAEFLERVFLENIGPAVIWRLQKINLVALRIDIIRAHLISDAVKTGHRRRNPWLGTDTLSDLPSLPPNPSPVSVIRISMLPCVSTHRRSKGGMRGTVDGKSACPRPRPTLGQVLGEAQNPRT
jgi:hypothetical protein